MPTGRAGRRYQLDDGDDRMNPMGDTNSTPPATGAVHGAVFSGLLLLACGYAPKLMGMVGLLVLACAVAIGLGVVFVALFVWGMFAAPMITLPLAFMVLALVDRR